MPRGVTLFDEQLIQGRVDSDALSYISRVERADGASLEPGIKVAINNFVISCKNSGLWSKLSVVVIIAGARTLSGAITTLKAPTGSLSDFSGSYTNSDYNRKNGITGLGGSSQFFSVINYNGTSEPLDDYHICVSLSSPLDTTFPSNVWGFGGTVYDTALTDRNFVYSRTSSSPAVVSNFGVGFSCLSRNNSSNFDWRNNKTTVNYSVTSVAANTDGFRLLRATTNTMKYFSGGKSISELPLYDELVSALLDNIARAVN
jgi:hypothetical protein